MGEWEEGNCVCVCVCVYVCMQIVNFGLEIS